MSSDGFERELPEWTFRGGHFRSGFSTNDIPTPWSRRTGKWKRDELVPYGKASEAYRKQFYLCPECDGVLLLPSEQEYTFNCGSCRIEFGWGFGGLYEKPSAER